MSGSASRSLNVLVSGASGLIGSHACRYLMNAGHGVSRLVRREPLTTEEIHWDPGHGRIEAARLAGFDAVVHLSGESIASRWTREIRQRIRDSRVGSTRLLAETLARLEPRPKVLVCASAVGYYGSRGDELLTEDSPPGKGFLAEVCRAWEQAADPARAAGIRVVHLRNGLVLTPAGGALAKMLMPFRFGLGGVIGSGDQWISWIGLTDLLRVIELAIVSSEVAGPINAVSPKPVTNREFTRTLGALLNRPTVMTVPSIVVRVALGPMADETLLASTRAIPERLLAAGFSFVHPELGEALRHEMASHKATATVLAN
jgi:uncharacterized protein (TIGR01777 family)